MRLGPAAGCLRGAEGRASHPRASRQAVTRLGTCREMIDNMLPGTEARWKLPIDGSTAEAEPRKPLIRRVTAHEVTLTLPPQSPPLRHLASRVSTPSNHHNHQANKAVFAIFTKSVSQERKRFFFSRTTRSIHKAFTITQPKEMG